MRWLLRWQHVAPNAQASGERGLLEVIRQLQGFEIPANAWEKQVLKPRMNAYDPAVLDQLCLTGAVGWGRLSPHPATLEDSGNGRRRVVPTSVAPITFFVREDSDWMQPRNPEDTENEERVLSESARTVADFLRRRGASFFADIVRGTGKLKAEIETALWELVAAGLVTADGFENLRSLISPSRRATPGAPKLAKPRHSTGRWSLLYAAEVTDRNKAVEAMCQMLLRRYGVVFREVLARESNLPKWRELLITFRRLEDRGEVRGGRFVSGFLGEQFALPEAVESLRAMRNLPATGETLVVSAADPLNLVGFIVPGERVPAISGRYVKFRDGVAVDPEERNCVVARGWSAMIEREPIEGIDYYLENGLMVFTAQYLRDRGLLLHVGMPALSLWFRAREPQPRYQAEANRKRKSSGHRARFSEGFTTEARRTRRFHGSASP